MVMNDSIIADDLYTYLKPSYFNNFVADPDSVLAHAIIDPIPYGQKRWDFPVVIPDEHIKKGVKFERQQKGINLQVVQLDLANFSDTLTVDRETVAAVPAAVTAAAGTIPKMLTQGIDRAVTIGDATYLPFVWGLIDAGTGSIGRPRTCSAVTAGGTSAPWYTVANLRKEVIQADISMRGERFYGRKALFMPAVLKPIFAELISNTSVPVAQWLESTAGYPCFFSNYVDADASPTAFDCFLVEIGTMHVGFTGARLDAYYVDETHQYNWDIEGYAAVGFEPKTQAPATASSYFKAVCKIAAAAYTSA